MEVVVAWSRSGVRVVRFPYKVRGSAEGVYHKGSEGCSRGWLWGLSTMSREVVSSSNIRSSGVSYHIKNVGDGV